MTIEEQFDQALKDLSQVEHMLDIIKAQITAALRDRNDLRARLEKIRNITNTW